PPEGIAVTRVPTMPSLFPERRLIEFAKDRDKEKTHRDSVVKPAVKGIMGHSHGHGNGLIKFHGMGKRNEEPVDVDTLANVVGKSKVTVVPGLGSLDPPASTKTPKLPNVSSKSGSASRVHFQEPTNADNQQVQHLEPQSQHHKETCPIYETHQSTSSITLTQTKTVNWQDWKQRVATAPDITDQFQTLYTNPKIAPSHHLGMIPRYFAHNSNPTMRFDYGSSSNVGATDRLMVWVTRARQGVVDDEERELRKRLNRVADGGGGGGAVVGEAVVGGEKGFNVGVVGVGAGEPKIMGNELEEDKRVVLILSSHLWDGGGNVRRARDGSLAYSIERKIVANRHSLVLRDQDGRKLWKLAERPGWTGWNYDLYRYKLSSSPQTTPTSY
ncbi:hypothetical protein HDU76_010559, partial [Blyttiomyces sp. JEL0837]